MLAKPRDGLPDGDGWLYEPKWDGFRAIVFRDGDEVLHPEPRPQAARPLLPGARRRRSGRTLPERCVVDGEVVIADATAGSSSRRCCCGSTRPRRGSKMLAEETPASFVALGPARARRRGPPRARPQGERRARLEAALGGVAAAGPPDAGDPRPRRSPPTGSTGSRAPASTASIAKRLDAAVPARQAGDAQDQAPAHRRLRRRRLPLAQERARARTSARCCSACSTTRARSTTSASRRRSRGTSARRWSTELEPLRENAHRRPSVGASGPSGRRWARPTPRASACPARRAAGTAARTCRGSRSAPSASSRSPTTTSRATASGTRTTFVRWRPDKQPADCRYDQLEETPAYEIAKIFGGDLERTRPTARRLEPRSRTRGSAVARHSAIGIGKPLSSTRPIGSNVARLRAAGRRRRPPRRRPRRRAPRRRSATRGSRSGRTRRRRGRRRARPRSRRAPAAGSSASHPARPGPASPGSRTPRSGTGAGRRRRGA